MVIAKAPGENALGRTLMRLRVIQRRDGPDRWPRIGVTGHRDLSAAQQRWVGAELARVLRRLQSEHDASTLIDGMAVGADLIAAAAALDVGLQLWAYLPFPEQTARWRPADTAHHEHLRAQAARTVVLGDQPAADARQRRYVRLLHDRNRLILRDCDALVAVHDRR